jgi:hypothetical protein
MVAPRSGQSLARPRLCGDKKRHPRGRWERGSRPEYASYLRLNFIASLSTVLRSSQAAEDARGWGKVTAYTPVKVV